MDAFGYLIDHPVLVANTVFASVDFDMSFLCLTGILTKKIFMLRACKNQEYVPQGVDYQAMLRKYKPVSPSQYMDTES